MKINRTEKPPIIIGGRIVVGQAIMGIINGAVLLFNYINPENPIDGAIAGYLGQPLIFAAQVWYVNRYGVTQ